MEKLITMLAEESDSMFSGVLTGAQGIIGIILFFTGIALVYFAVKVMKGYRILPQQEACEPKEDTYMPANAEVLRKQITEMPSINGNETVIFTEWVISYTVDGEQYKQIIPDGQYNKGDMLDIKYNPDNPKEYYLDYGVIAEKKTEENDEDKLEKSPLSTAMIILAGLFIIIGAVLFIDRVI